MIKTILQCGTKATGLMLAFTLLAALLIAQLVSAPLFQLKKIVPRLQNAIAPAKPAEFAQKGV